MKFTQREQDVLSRYFTNTESSVFALVNMPEVIKGTLISRYSRSNKDMRRLFLDEFLEQDELKDVLDTDGDDTADETLLKLQRAEDFYERILVGFGDDSVAELGSAHLALEEVSMLAAKEIEEHRIGFSPLEVSSRYVYFDQKEGGLFRYYRDPVIMDSNFKDVYVKAMDSLFTAYSTIVHDLQPTLREVYPGNEDDIAYTFSIRAKACDIARNLLPTGSYTRMGMLGNGRAYEYMLMHFLSHPLSEVREIGQMMEENLNLVMPAFLKRVRSEKGEAYREYLASREHELAAIIDKTPLRGVKPRKMTVKLVDKDPKALEKVISAILYSRSSAPYAVCRKSVRSMTGKEKEKIVRAYFSGRGSRHHKPGRECEEPYFSFDVTADWGVYKDLQRHRIVTRHRKLFTNGLGYRIPDELRESPLRAIYEKAQKNAAQVQKDIAQRYPYESQYLTTHGAYNRFYMRMNLREAIHLTELRSSKQGHPWYREVAQEIAREISREFPLIGKYAFGFVDYKQYHLERLEAFTRIERKAKKKGVTVFSEDV